MYRHLTCLLVTLLGFLPSSASAGFIVTSGSHAAYANSYSYGLNSEFAFSTAIPWNQTITMNLADGTNAQNTVSRTLTAGGIQLQSNFSLFAAPSTNLNFWQEAHATGHEYFTTDAATSYSITGLLNVTTDGGYSESIQGYLYDLTMGQIVADFFYLQIGGNAVLELGEPLGLNRAIGNLTGTLAAGHQCFFHYRGYVQNYDRVNYDPEANGLTGNGYVTLTLGTVAVETPEPASLIVWGFLGSCAAVAGYRRRKQLAA